MAELATTINISVILIIVMDFSQNIVFLDCILISVATLALSLPGRICR